MKVRAGIYDTLTREDYKGLRGHGFDLPSEEWVVKNLVNLAILLLYRLDPGTVIKLDERRAKEAGVFDEPVNWGDVSCRRVRKRKDGTFVAYVEEASPEAENFQEYLESWLKKWGWEVSVRLSW